MAGLSFFTTPSTTGENTFPKTTRRLPVGGGPYSIRVSADCWEHQIHMAFYNAQGVLTTPTGGTATVRAGMFEGQTQDLPDGVVDATEVEAGNVTYDPPTWSGPSRFVEVTLVGVTGVTHVEIIHAGWS